MINKKLRLFKLVIYIVEKKLENLILNLNNLYFIVKQYLHNNYFAK